MPFDEGGLLSREEQELAEIKAREVLRRLAVVEDDGVPPYADPEVYRTWPRTRLLALCERLPSAPYSDNAPPQRKEQVAPPAPRRTRQTRARKKVERTVAPDRNWVQVNDLGGLFQVHEEEGDDS
jgi:hypothetical protein